MKKWVYLFTEGNANMRELLGGKGANLAEMTNIGLPVPQYHVCFLLQRTTGERRKPCSTEITCRTCSCEVGCNAVGEERRSA